MAAPAESRLQPVIRRAVTGRSAEGLRTALREARPAGSTGRNTEHHESAPGGCGLQVQTARLGSARLGSARPGSARLGSVQIGSAAVSWDRLGSVWLTRELNNQEHLDRLLPRALDSATETMYSRGVRHHELDRCRRPTEALPLSPN